MGTSMALLILYKVLTVGFDWPDSIFDILAFWNEQASASWFCVHPFFVLNCLILTPRSLINFLLFISLIVRGKL